MERAKWPRSPRLKTFLAEAGWSWPRIRLACLSRSGRAAVVGVAARAVEAEDVPEEAVAPAAEKVEVVAPAERAVRVEPEVQAGLAALEEPAAKAAPAERVEERLEERPDDL